MDSNKKYYAFISYSHADSDWAKWLQHELEYYQLPATLNGRQGLPSSFRPVFRDEDELAGGNLKPQISAALASSEFLIVICSPNSAKSEYVNNEITEFIEIGKRRNEDYTKRIFPLIVDGKPHQKSDSLIECFPPSIKEMKDIYGNHIELIAGDVTATGRSHAFIKILSGTLKEKNVQFSELWNRYEKYKLEEEKRRKEEQMKICKANVRFISERSNKIFYEGNSYACRKAFVELYGNNEDYPYVGEADKALRLAMEQDSLIINIGRSNLSSVAISSKGDKLAVASVDENAILLYEIVNGHLLLRIDNISSSGYRKMQFIDNDGRILLLTIHGLLMVDLTLGMVVEEFKVNLNFDTHFISFFYDENKQLIFCASTKWGVYKLKKDGLRLLNEYDFKVADIIISTHKHLVQDSYTQDVSIKEYVNRCELNDIIHIEDKLICSFNDGKLRYLSMAEDRDVKIKKLFKEEIVALNLSQDKKHIFAATNTEIKAFSVSSLRVIELIQLSDILTESTCITHVQNIGNSIVLSTWNVNLSESQLLFLVKQNKNYHLIEHLTIKDSSRIIGLIWDGKYVIYNTIIGKIKLISFNIDNCVKLKSTGQVYSMSPDSTNNLNVILSHDNEYSKFNKVGVLTPEFDISIKGLIPNVNHHNFNLPDFKYLINTELDFRQDKVCVTKDKRFCVFVNGNEITILDFLNQGIIKKKFFNLKLWFETVNFHSNDSFLITSTKEAIQLWEFPSLLLVNNQLLDKTIKKGYGSVLFGNEYIYAAIEEKLIG